MMRAQRVAASVLALLVALPPCVGAPADPAVPAGRDIGGIPVALIGSGIDYTREAIALRLARDGEGEITGYDYIDDDRRPFASGQPGEDMAEIVIGEGQTASLIVLRADGEDVLSLSRALLFAGKSPARIILVEGVPRDVKSIEALASAARYFHDRLFIVAAGDEGRNLDQERASALRGLPNAVIVTAAAPDGTNPARANTGALTIDLATSAAPLKGEGTKSDHTAASSLRAAAHIAALAVRLTAVEPAIPAKAMKVRIADLARPVATPGGNATRHGVIERPERHFWLE